MDGKLRDVDGKPQYVYYAPFTLWKWVNAHEGKLPCREGRIWLEDFWELAKLYRVRRRPIPEFVSSLDSLENAEKAEKRRRGEDDEDAKRALRARRERLAREWRA